MKERERERERERGRCEGKGRICKNRNAFELEFECMYWVFSVGFVVV
jgi:hypothetical protein